MTLITLSISVQDGEPMVDLRIDTGTGADEPDTAEYSEEEREAAANAIEAITGRDMNPDSPTLEDDLMEAEDPEVVEIERNPDASDIETAPKTDGSAYVSVDEVAGGEVMLSDIDSP